MMMALHHEFVVGSTFQDRLGKYRVISLDGSRMVIEYLDGSRRENTIADKWRIHCNMVASENAPIKAPPSRRLPKRRSGAIFFTHEEVFPIIADVIQTFGATSTEFMAHQYLVEAFMKHPQAQLILSRPHDKTDFWWASSMVQWFSKVFTEGRSDWNGTFDRTQIDGDWAYRKHRGTTSRAQGKRK
jgi:hypothetical protein